MRVLLILSVLALAACGADGEPEQPGGSSVSGEAQIGVVGEI
jgi:hypothetical protein